MSSEHFDLVVIGAGPAGEKGAVQAAYFDKRVAIIEKEPDPGGAAVHTGTLPSKTLRETALYLSGYRSRDLYGVAVEMEPGATLPRLMSRKNAIANAESRAFRHNFSKHLVTYIQGHASFEGQHQLLIKDRGEERRVTAEHFLIATGSRPYRPPEIDFTDSNIHDSDEVLWIETLPKSLTILGAGVIGCEYACMFAALGVRVALVDAREEILPFLDMEIVERLRKAMDRLGIVLIRGHRWGSVKRSGNVIATTLADGSVLESQDVLFAAGRTGNTSSLGLEKLGISPDSRGYLRVDSEFRTSLRHVSAAGDVIGFPALASVSMEQARVAVCHAFEFGYKTQIARQMPYGIYTIPEVSSFGETEETCREKGIAYVVGRALFGENPRGKITGDLEGVTKLIVERTSRRLIGVHVIGERASELVHIGQCVVLLGGNVDVFIEMVFNYPTLSDSFKYAAYACLHELDRSQAPDSPRVAEEKPI